jgi:thiamine-phosphate pyrophosphorylase
LDQVRAAAAGGAWAVQLRDKTTSDADLCEIGKCLMKVLAGSGVKLFVNDRVNVAREILADGLHIGQSDGDPHLIRARIWPSMLLGLSIETPDQARVIPPDVD